MIEQPTKANEQPSPVLFFETVTAYQRSAAIKAAIELDLFTAIAEGKHSAFELAEGCGAAERGVRMLCDYLAMLGFLTKQDRRYQLTQDSAIFLNKRSPVYIGSAVEFLLSPMVRAGFDSLTEAVRRGGTAVGEGGTIAPEHPVWVQFARGMAPIMKPPAEAMARLVDPHAARTLKVLDIAAGHGVFGIAFAQRNPNVEVAAVDWPGVLEVAKENAAAAGVASRYRTIAGSAFEVDFGGGYDLALLTNFLHHFDAATCVSLLRKVHAALGDGGRAVTLEFVPNDDRVSPPGIAGFSLVMLAGTPSGDAYTFGELDQMFRSAGFLRNEMQQLPPMQQLIVSYR